MATSPSPQRPQSSTSSGNDEIVIQRKAFDRVLDAGYTQANARQAAHNRPG